MELVRWGIIGCGDVTEKKSGPGFQLADGSRLVAVMRRDAEKARDYAERHGVPRWYSTVEGLLADPEVDAVYIATPPGSHLEIAKEVARSGKPCYLEKPMARNKTESKAIADAFGSQPLYVAYYRRCYNRFIRLKALLDSGSYGPVSAVHYRMERPATSSGGWRQDVPVSGGGLFVDVGSHVLDLLDFLLGPLKLRGLAGRSTASGPEDMVALCFTYASGTGTASWNFNGCSSLDVLEITTTKAKVLLPDLLNGSKVTITTEKDTETWEEAPPATVQLPLIQSIVDALRASQSCPSTGSSALRTAGYLDEALESFYKGRADEFWTRPETWG